MNRLLIPFIISAFLLGSVTAPGQECACTNCDQPIPPNATTTISFEVAGATNNNLANASQGVCGVIVEFRHDFIWSVEMILTSPLGQQITLIGPPVTPPLGSYTGFAYWDISFVPAFTAASPDPPFNVTWSNNQSWQTAGQYSGSYYPFAGNLEDFNSGPVNGFWTLQIINSNPFYAGHIDDFRLIFCDDSGLNCFECLADAGDLSAESNVEGCTGAASLAFVPSPDYPAGSPDPALYNYNFIILRNDTILEFTSSPDLSTMPAGSYEVCGFSYLTEHQNRLPTPPLIKNDLLSDINAPINPLICGDITANCINVLIHQGAINELADTICEGGIYNFGGNTYSTAGTYSYSLPTVNQCDSTIRVLLTVTDTSLVSLTPSICMGQSYEMGGVDYTLSGHYETLLTGVNGCDSLVVLDLLVNDTSLVSLTPSICMGQSYEMGGVDYTLSGHYETLLIGANGCDSLVVLDLLVNDTSLVSLTPGICMGQSYEMGGVDYTLSGHYETLLIGVNGCDSLVVLDLLVNDTSLVSLTPSICMGQSYEMGGVDYTLSGHYETLLTGVNGCDSLVVLDLLVNDTSLVSLTPSICMGQSYEMGGVDYTLSGHYETLLIGANGCDSLVVLDLAVSDTVVTALTPSICTGQSYEMGGVDYTLSGHYETLLTGVNGCDSLVVLDLAVSDTVVTALTPSICTGQSYEMGGVDYTLSGHYETLLTGVNGCDSLVVLDLAVSDTVVTALTPSICTGQSYEMGGVDYTLSGHYETLLTGVNGCDSLVVLDLLVNDTSLVSLTPGICMGQSYEMGGVDYTLSGHYETLLTGVNGCDSLVVLDLLVNDTSLVSLTPGICMGQSYEMGGVDYTLSGHYETLLIGANGCDSLVVLDLAVSDTVVTALTPSICTGQSYEMGGVDYTLSGHYETLLTGVNGCDSLVVLDLLVNDTSLVSLTPSICMGQSYEMGGVDYTLSGHYETLLIGVNGCDSLVVLDLAVSDTVVTALTPSICTGQSYEMGGVDYTLSGHYETLLTGVNGCDSLVVLDLAVSDTVVTALTPSICTGQSYEMGGVDYTLSGHYETLLIGVNGCDSLVVLDLAVSDTVVTALTPSICTGQSYEMGGVDYTLSGHYETLLIGVNGCDSLVVLDLAVSDTVVTALTPSICTGQSYEMGGVDYTLSGHYETLLIGVNGCDSLVVLDLLVNDTSLVSLTPSICMGQSYEMGGVDYTLSGHYETLLIGVNGCDSLVVLDLAVSDTVVTALTPSICTGQSYEMGGVDYTLSGHYETLLIGVNDCDSLVVLDLAVSDTVVTALTPSICTGQSYEMGGVDYTLSGHYETLLIGVNDCDSLVVLDLAVSDTVVTALTPSICTGQSYEMGGVDYTLSGHYETLLIGVNGCDSLVVLDLAVSDTVVTALTPSICTGQSYEMGGVDYTLSGHYETLLTGVNGCDSLVVLDLAVSDTVVTALTPSICTGQSYEMGGVDYTLSGHYETLLTGVNGCDSLVVLDLAVSDTVVTALTPSICTGQSYEMGGVDYTLSGHYETLLIGVNGCDSLVVLDLAVSDTVVTALTPSICTGQSYEMGGVDYTLSGHYETLLTGVNGCDSLVVLDLAVSDTVVTALTPSICTGQSYEMGGVDYTLSGHYETLLTGVNGCDSLVVLDLAVSDTVVTALTPSICTGQSYEMGGVDYTLSGHYETLLIGVNGCDSLVVLDLAVIEMELYFLPTDTLDCQIDAVLLKGVVENNGGALSYDWSLAGGTSLSDTFFVRVFEPGDYVFTVTESSAGCTLSDTLSLEQNIAQPFAYAGIIGNQSLDCSETPVLLSASNSMPFGQLQFSWYQQNTLISNLMDVEVEVSGNYQLIVQNIENGCKDTSYMQVGLDTLPPSVSIQPPSELSCKDSILLLNAMTSSSGPGFHFQWQASQGGHIVAGDTSLMPLINAAGAYTLVITNDENSCVDSAEVWVFADQQAPQAVAGRDTSLDCFTPQILLNGSSSSVGPLIHYQWNGPAIVAGDTTLFPAVEASGTYMLLVTNQANGCTASDEVIVAGSNEGVQQVGLLAQSPDCVDKGFIRIDAIEGGIGPYMYSIDNQPFTSQSNFEFLEDGSYQISIQDAAGCEWDTTILLSAVQPLVLALGIDTLIDLGDSILLHPQFNKPQSQLVRVEWLPLEQVSCPACLSQFIRPLATVTVELTIVDEAGCTATDRKTIHVRTRDPLFIPNAFSPNGDGINDMLQLFASAAVAEIKTFKLFDRYGENVYEALNFQPNDPSRAWGGFFRGRLMNPQVFVYFAEVELIDGSIQLYKGDVTLIR